MLNGSPKRSISITLLSSLHVSGYVANSRVSRASHTIRMDHRSGRCRLRSGPHFTFGLHGELESFAGHRTRSERITEGSISITLRPSLHVSGYVANLRVSRGITHDSNGSPKRSISIHAPALTSRFGFVANSRVSRGIAKDANRITEAVDIDHAPALTSRFGLRDELDSFSGLRTRFERITEAVDIDHAPALTLHVSGYMAGGGSFGVEQPIRHRNDKRVNAVDAISPRSVTSLKPEKYGSSVIGMADKRAAPAVNKIGRNLTTTTLQDRIE